MSGLTVPRGWADAPPNVPGYRTKDIPKELVAQGHAAIVSVAERSKRPQQILEIFKRAFADWANASRPWKSTDYNFAVVDLRQGMEEAAANAVQFITGFCEGIYEIQSVNGVKRPLKVSQLNTLLRKHKLGYTINDWKLETVSAPNLVVKMTATNWDIVHEEVRTALAESRALLARKQWRDAIQKSWWIIESTSMLYAESVVGDQPVHGTYYNEIVKPLAKSKDNPFRSAVLRALGPLQGILNNPRYGVRHGMAEATHPWQEREAALLVNLCHAYSDYILAEYRSLVDAGKIKRAQQTPTQV